MARSAKKALALALLVGAAIGAAGVKALHAQGGVPPAYVIVEQDVTDRETFQKFSKAYSAAVAPYNVHFLAAGGRTASVFGSPPPRQVAVIAFPSMAEAQRFYASPAYLEIKPLRDRSVSEKSRTFIVEGKSP
ncbi:MAG TPA: DUF1330 domain-containing protein [Alphaproteobacteria bacterium]